MMRTNNGHVATQSYRVVTSNKRINKSGKNRLTATQQQRLKQIVHTKHKHEEEYLEDDLAPYSDGEEFVTETETEQDDEHKRAFTSLASTVRPLLQLFSEELKSVQKPEFTANSINTQAPTPAKQKILYKHISLLSDEENDTASEKEEGNVFLAGKPENPIVEEPEAPQRISFTRFVWTPKSTNVLLQLWEKHLRDLRGKQKNAHVHRVMANEMSEYRISTREIKSKMDNMTRKYRLEAEKIKSGVSTNWRYFKKLQELLVGTPAVDFEEIIFDNTASSTFFNTDSSDTESEMRQEEDPENPPTSAEAMQEAMDEEDEEQLEDKYEHPPAVLETSLKEEHRMQLKRNAGTTNRMLEIKEEKLQIDKQKLQVMKHMSRDLASINKSLLELIRNTRK